MTLSGYLAERTIPEPNSGCLLWLASCNPDGYGIATYPGAPRGAHRASWKAKHGTVPAGISVLHKCDVRCCINPDHLFLGTQLDNMRDKMAKGRHVSHPGERHGRAKITTDQALAILADSRFHKDIAAEYGISPSAVTYLKLGKRWRHLSSSSSSTPAPGGENG